MPACLYRASLGFPLEACENDGFAGMDSRMRGNDMLTVPFRDLLITSLLVGLDYVKSIPASNRDPGYLE